MKKKTLVIAEAGVNHNGDINIAKKLIKVAASSGADIIKFQTFKAESLVRKKTSAAKYQNRNLKKKISQFQLLKKLELDSSDYIKLKKYSKKNKIEFLSSPFGINDLKFLIKIGIKRIKIPSGELNNKPLLEFISKQNLPVILSTGMATLTEIKEAISLLLTSGLQDSKLTILHCTTDYPTKLKDVNLKFIQTLSNIFNLQFGYSDHTSGIEIPMAATAMGCSIIEKHITLDKSSIGPDHAASLNPSEFKKMVESIRKIDIGLGKNKKILSAAEKKNKLLVRKSIVANKLIKKGQLFTIKNITTKRPGTGISPMHWNKVLGKKAKKNFYKDEFIEL